MTLSTLRTSPSFVFSAEPTNDEREVLERFVVRCLYEAGVWSSPRISDGVSSYRAVERGPMRTRMCGRIWEIDQTQRVFWLDIERSAVAPERVTWTLYFDIDLMSTSAHRAAHAVEAVQDPSELTWVVTLTGSE